MKDLKVLAITLNKLGYYHLADSILKISEQTSSSKPQKLKIFVKSNSDNRSYSMTITPILSDGKTGSVETINFTPSNGPVKLLPDKPLADIINKFFGPNTILSSGMVDLMLPPGKTNQDFGLIIK